MMGPSDPPAAPRWSDWLAELRALADDAEVDAWLDARLETVAAISPADSAAVTAMAPPAAGDDSTEFWLAALGRARAESTRRDVAWRLARDGRVGDLRVADALSAAFAEARDHPSLGPALLAALAERGVRDGGALPDVLRALVRLPEDAPRYLAVAAAKVIGRFEGRGVATQARARLDDWAQADDLAVQGEARQQLALLALADALGAPNAPRLLVALRDCRAAFARAAASEELRHDARLAGGVVDLLVTHLKAPGASAAYAAAVGPKAAELKRLLDDPRERPWAGYALGAERVLEHRAYRVATGFARLADDASGAEEWTNFDAALKELAAAWQLMWGRAAEEPRGVFGAVERAPRDGAEGDIVSERVGEGVVLPRVGTFLARAVGRQRLLRVVEHAEAARGPADERARILRTFYDAAARAPAAPADGDGGRGDGLGIDRNALLALAARDPAAAVLVARVVPGADVVLGDAGLELRDGADGARAFRVPTDFPDCYGNDPGVDETVRRLLADAAERLPATFPLAQWRRFEALTVSVVQIARDLRNDLPTFLLREDDGGLGQRAREDDLQRYVFDVLRREYGSAVHWEPTRIAGGRGDTGVFFPEGRFPVEVKAEFAHVDRAHLRAAYLTQPDRYATDRDGVSYLLVLDARGVHAAAGTALYRLRESFWVDGLLTDPQITDALSNAVIVGLFPGNQSRPSATTTYSRAPRARRPRERRARGAARSDGAPGSDEKTEGNYRESAGGIGGTEPPLAGGPEAGQTRA